jgi:hypothetical protein
METLHQYTQRTAPDRTQREWADLLGTSRSYFCEIVNGTKRPGPKLIRQIDKMTGGRVPPTVWYRDCVGGSEASSPVPCEMQSINAANPAPADAACQREQTGISRGQA